MCKLAIQYPTRHHNEFKEFCDFYYIDMTDGAPSGLPLEVDKLYWLDYYNNAKAFQHITKSTCEFADVFILPGVINPDENVVQAAKLSTRFEVPTAAVWTGERQHIRLLEQAVDIVCLPWWNHQRRHYIKPEDAHTFHFYEFCNLDELRRYKCASIHTNVPITAALMGIELNDRERRPKKLSPFSYDLKLTTPVIDLAIKNIMHIKEAIAYEPGQHSSIHS